MITPVSVCLSIQFPLNVNLFLQPVETDGDLLWRYVSALVTAGIK